MSQILEAESRLIGDMYDATLDPGLWPTVVQRFAEVAQADQANVLAFDRLNPDYFLFHGFGSQPEHLELYQSGGFAPLDMEFAGRWMLAGGGLGKAVANHQHEGGLAGYQRAAGRLFTEFFDKVDIYYQCGGLLEMTDFRWSVLGLHRGREGGAFEDETIATVSRLMPHLRRALQIHRQLVAANQRNARLYRLLDGLATGVVLVDSGNRIRYANPQAERLLQQHDGLSVDARHTLHASSPALNTDLQALLAGAIRVSQREASALGAGGVLACPDRVGTGMLMLTVAPLSELAGYAELSSEGIAAAVFLTDPEAWQCLSQALLKRAYGLSDRECALCEAFANHPTLEGVASHSGLSLSSVRTYMKEIYAKTGRRSQAELMHLLKGLRLDFEHIR
ncbi:MAG: PAS domain-containing protein [Pseudomonadota bacterium]